MVKRIRKLKLFLLFPLFPLFFLPCCDETTIQGIDLSRYNIVYRDESYCISIIKADGQNRQRIVDSRNFPVQPKYSPQGNKIAYYLITDRFWLCIYDIAKEISYERLAFIKTEDSGPLETYSWSPDGSKIAFNRGNGFEYSDIFILDINNKKTEKITDGGYNIDPKWTSDGNNIYFISLDLKSADNKSKAYLFNTEFRKIKELIKLDENQFCAYVYFSTEGKEFLGVTNNKLNLMNNCSLCRFDLNGNIIKTLLEIDNGSIVGAIYAKNEPKIFFTQGDGISLANSNIYSIYSDGTEIRQITSCGNIETFKLSPDGKLIFYLVSNNTTFDILHICSSDGSNDMVLDIKVTSFYDLSPSK